MSQSEINELVRNSIIKARQQAAGSHQQLHSHPSLSSRVIKVTDLHSTSMSPPPPQQHQDQPRRRSPDIASTPRRSSMSLSSSKAQPPRAEFLWTPVLPEAEAEPMVAGHRQMSPKSFQDEYPEPVTEQDQQQQMPNATEFKKLSGRDHFEEDRREDEDERRQQEEEQLQLEQLRVFQEDVDAEDMHPNLDAIESLREEISESDEVGGNDDDELHQNGSRPASPGDDQHRENKSFEFTTNVGTVDAIATNDLTEGKRSPGASPERQEHYGEEQESTAVSEHSTESEATEGPSEVDDSHVPNVIDITERDIAELVQHSMDKAQKSAREEVKDMLKDSRRKKDSIEIVSADGQKRVLSQREIADLVTESMRKARETAQEEIANLVKDSVRVARESAREEIQNMVQESMLRARESAQKEMSEIVRESLQKARYSDASLVTANSTMSGFGNLLSPESVAANAVVHMNTLLEEKSNDSPEEWEYQRSEDMKDGTLERSTHKARETDIKHCPSPDVFFGIDEGARKQVHNSTESMHAVDGDAESGTSEDLSDIQEDKGEEKQQEDSESVILVSENGLQLSQVRSPVEDETQVNDDDQKVKEKPSPERNEAKSNQGKNSLYEKMKDYEAKKKRDERIKKAAEQLVSPRHQRREKKKDRGDKKSSRRNKKNGYLVSQNEITTPKAGNVSSQSSLQSGRSKSSASNSSTQLDNASIACETVVTDQFLAQIASKKGRKITAADLARMMESGTPKRATKARSDAEQQRDGIEAGQEITLSEAEDQQAKDQARAVLEQERNRDFDEVLAASSGENNRQDGFCFNFMELLTVDEEHDDHDDEEEDRVSKRRKAKTRNRIENRSVVASWIDALAEDMSDALENNDSLDFDTDAESTTFDEEDQAQTSFDDDDDSCSSDSSSIDDTGFNAAWWEEKKEEKRRQRRRRTPKKKPQRK